jgi:hypothetical protein
MRLEKKRTVGRLEVKEYVIRGQFYTEQELTDDYVHAYLGSYGLGLPLSLLDRNTIGDT